MGGSDDDDDASNPPVEEDDTSFSDDDSMDDGMDDGSSDDDALNDDISDDDNENDDNSDDDLSNDDIADDDTADDDVQPDTWGGVFISEGYSSSNIFPLDYYCAVSASFYNPDDYEGWGDPVDEVGDCSLYDYSGGTSDLIYLSAGNISVTGTKVGTIHLTPVAYQYGFYYQADVDFTTVSDLFDANNEITAHVNGGSGIGPLSLSVLTPPLIHISQPSNFDNLTSPPQGNITYKWTTGGAQTVSISISTFKSGSGIIIECTAPDDQGQIMVDKSLTDELLHSYDSFSISIDKSNMEWSGESRPILIVGMTYRQRTIINTE